jgi:hypothetical protein
MSRDAWCLIICLIALTGLFMLQSKPPERYYIAPVEMKRVMHEVHGIWFMECREGVCKFKRKGKTVTLRKSPSY